MGYPLPSTDPLGTDILLDENGDIIIDTSGSIQTVSNEDNVAQALRVMLTVTPNTYLWDDDVGSNLAEYVDQPITDKMRQEITSIITERAQTDTRIIDVLEVLVDDSYVDTLVIFVTANVSSIGIVQIPITVTGGA